jgi:hypothetical protein
MKATALTTYRYVPRWAGNSSDPEPMAVVLRRPTVGEARAVRDAQHMALRGAVQIAESQSTDKPTALLAVVAEATSTMDDGDDALGEAIRPLLVSVESLDLGSPDEDPIAWVLSQPGLRGELVEQIIASSRPTATEGNG